MLVLNSNISAVMKCIIYISPAISRVLLFCHINQYFCYISAYNINTDLFLTFEFFI